MNRILANSSFGFSAALRSRNIHQGRPFPSESDAAKFLQNLLAIPSPSDPKASLTPALKEQLQALGRELDPEFFQNGLLQLGVRLKNEGDEAKALAIFQFLSGSEIPEGLQSRALQEIRAMEGRGSSGLRGEYLLGRMSSEVTDYRNILPMVAGTAVGQLAKGWLLTRFALSPQATGITRGLVGRFLATSFGLAVEVPTFALGARALQGSGEGTEAPWARQLACIGSTLGALKFSAWMGKKLPSFTQPFSVFLGLLAARRTEVLLGLKKETADATLLTDTLASWLSLSAGAHLGQHFLGRGGLAIPEPMGSRARPRGPFDVFTKAGTLQTAELGLSWNGMKSSGDRVSFQRGPNSGILLSSGSSGDPSGKLKRWAAALRDDKKATNRARAAEKLGKSGSPDAVEPLIQALNDPNLKVRMEAAKALGAIGDRRAMDPLLRVLKESHRYPIFERGIFRGEAALALVNFGGKEVLAALLEVLKDPLFDHSAPINDKLIKAIGKMGAPALAPLLQIMEGPQWKAQEGVQRVLEDFQDPRALPELLQALEHSNPMVRGGAARGLGNIKDARAVDPLISLLDDPEPDVRVSVVIALQVIKDPRAIEPLIPLLDDPDVFIQKTVVRALGQLGGPRALEVLIRTLQDPHLGGKAAEALGNMVEPSAVAALVQALENPELGTRWGAVSALRHHSDPGVLEALIAAGQDPRLAFDAVLTMRTVPNAGPSLIVTLGSQDLLTRLHSVWTLGRIPYPKAMDSLIRLISDPKSDFLTVNEAIRAIKELLTYSEAEGIEDLARPLARALGDYTTLQKIYFPIKEILFSKNKKQREFWAKGFIPLIREPHSDLRAGAALALGMIGGPTVIEPLIRALEGPSVWVRSCAAYGLGEAQRGQNRAIPLLLPSLWAHALVDPDPLVRTTSRQVLHDLSPGSNEPLKDPDFSKIMGKLVLRTINKRHTITEEVPLFAIVFPTEKGWRDLFLSLNRDFSESDYFQINMGLATFFPGGERYWERTRSFLKLAKAIWEVTPRPVSASRKG